LVFSSKISWTPFPGIFFLTFFYFFLIKAFHNKSSIFWLFSGVFAGLSAQLHYLYYLTIPTALIPLLANKRKRISHLFLFLFGFIIGDLPIILFEFRHNFLNIGILTNNLFSQKASLITFSSLIYGLKTATTGLLKFLTDLLSPPLLAIAFLIILSQFSSLKQRLKERKASFWPLLIPIFINLLVLSILGVSQSHYFFISIFPLAVIFANFLCSDRFQPQLLLIIVLIFTSLNLTRDIRSLKANTGYYMPRGWNIKNLQEVGKIIKNDVVSTSAHNFNLAWFIDGNTRAYALRFYLIKEGLAPEPVESFSNPQALYILYDNSRGSIYQEKTWEVSAYKPFMISKEWQLFDQYSLFKLTKEPERYN